MIRRLAFAALLLLGVGGCASVAPVSAGPETAPAPHAAPVDASSPGPSARAAEPLPAAEPDAKPSALELGCPEEMALVVREQGRFCIDRWEATLVTLDSAGRQQPWPGNRTVDPIREKMRAVSAPGRKPQGYISGEEAGRACVAAGKRLCEMDEWVRACRGPLLSLYPYGSERRPNVCNDRFRKLDYHPVPRLFRETAAPGTDPRLMWHPTLMNEPRLHELSHTVTLTGSLPGCTNEYGVFDMVGNLHEWIADPDGTFVGGFFMDTFQNGEGCEYRTVAHPIGYHDYSTGFRCCADPSPGGSPPA